MTGTARVGLNYRQLFGEREKSTSEPPTGRLLATVRCMCGSAIGRVLVDSQGEFLVANSVRLSPAQAADQLIQLALRDVEHLAAIGDREQTPTESDAVEAIGPLVHGLNTSVSAPPVSGFTIPGVVFNLTDLRSTKSPSSLTACNKCRRTWNLAPAISEWQQAGRRSEQIVVAGQHGAGKSRTWVNYEEPVTDIALSSRVAIYRQILGALNS